MARAILRSMAATCPLQAALLVLELHQAEDPDDDEVDRDDVVEQARHREDEHPGNERDDGLDGDVHAPRAYAGIATRRTCAPSAGRLAPRASGSLILLKMRCSHGATLVPVRKERLCGGAIGGADTDRRTG